MNDRTHRDPDASSEGPQEKHETIVLFEKLQELRDALRKVGVVQVVATYEKNAVLLAVPKSLEVPILVPNIVTVADELGRLLAIVVRRRCREGLRPSGALGIIQLAAHEDVLAYEHTMTLKGLP